MEDTQNPISYFILFSQDRRLAQTRQWVLEQALFRIATVYTLADLDTAGFAFNVPLFLLCNSLSAALRAEAVAHIRSQWPAAKILIFVPSYPLPELPADEFFYAMEGPGKLIHTIRNLIPHDQPSVN